MKQKIKIALVICLLACFVFAVFSTTTIFANVARSNQSKIIQQTICPECGVEVAHQGLHCDICGALIDSTKFIAGLLVAGIGFVLIPLMILWIMEVADYCQTQKQIQENQAEIARLINSLEDKK